ncbi:MAG: hypothetical protein WCR54_05645 [Clostridia bacterium]
MKERFEDYIKVTLKSIGEGERQEKYRQKMLDTLVDYAQECKIKGMDNSELIYTTSIEKLGDILEKYTEMEERKEENIKKIKKIGISFIIGLVVILSTILAYIIVSAVTKSWDKTWLILVGGVFATIITATIFISISFVKKQQWIPIRIFAAVDIALIFTLVFLCFIMLTDTPKSFVLFIIMTIMISGVDTAIAYGINSKTRLIDLIVFIQTATALEYVMLGILKMVSWHPYWIIPVVGAFINMVIVSIVLYMKYKNKKEKQ